LISSKPWIPDTSISPAKHPIGTGADRRRRCRAKIVGRVHARGGVGTLDLFEDVGKSIDVSLDGVLWSTSRGGYWVGQVLEVTFPYWTSPTAINQARTARVVRNLLLPDFNYAVAVQFEKGASAANGNPLTTARRPDQVRVLGVEADPSVASALRILFEQDGYQVVLVSTGQQALDILESDTPDVLIAEAEGNGVTGRELCAIAKKNLRLKHIPVILLTNSALPSDYSANYRAGAVVCMMRPCEPQRLRNAVHLVAPPPGQRSAYSAGFNLSAFVRTS
jgi:CheY-like chemotaxis protein